MNLSTVIMAHPSREHLVEELLTKLGEKVPVVWDEKDSCWDTGRRALLAHSKDADWALTIQDDAVVCLDFLDGVRRALVGMEDRPVSFYLDPVIAHNERIVYNGEPMFGKGSGPYGGVAVAVPVRDIPNIVRYGDAVKSNKKLVKDSYDKRLARYYGGKGVQCWYVIPCLCDHRSQEEAPTLRPKYKSAERQALAFIGEDVSALGFVTMALRDEEEINGG